MKKVLIIGGGLAGLSAATLLAEKEFRVTLIESTPTLGGRAKSFYSKDFGEYLDLGQHLLLGCYDATLDFLQRINALENFEISTKLAVPFFEEGGKQTFLKIRSSLYPFNLLSALLRFGAVPVRKRIKMLLPFLSLLSLNETFAPDLNAWLTSLKQDESIRKGFWDVLSIGAMNAKPALSDVGVFKNVLSQMFLRGNKGFKFIVARKSLYESYVKKVEEFLLSKGAEIRLSEKAVSIKERNGKIDEVTTSKTVYNDFDFVISALPFEQAKKVFGERFFPYGITKHFRYSPILNLHLKLKSNPFNFNYAALINSDIHWVFNKVDYVTLVTSAAENLINEDSEKLKEKFTEELRNYIPCFYPDLVEKAVVVKEKRATFVPSAGFEKARKNIRKSFGNLFFAGDWTYSGLPATMESATKSGADVAREIIKKGSL